jgi:hypothetical protein
MEVSESADNRKENYGVDWRIGHDGTLIGSDTSWRGSQRASTRRTFWKKQQWEMGPSKWYSCEWDDVVKPGQNSVVTGQRERQRPA